MTDPITWGEWTKRFHSNEKVDGNGLDMAVHAPCPFCAAPDFMLLHPMAGILPGDDSPTLYDELAQETTCKECGRSATHIITHKQGTVLTEIVQTGGPDPPAYITPPPRRIKKEEA